MYNIRKEHRDGCCLPNNMVVSAIQNSYSFIQDVYNLDAQPFAEDKLTKSDRQP